MNGEALAGDAVESPVARLAGLRARLGLSQEQLARELGVSFATVNRWEAGHTQMSARAARALAEFEARHPIEPQHPPGTDPPVARPGDGSSAGRPGATPVRPGATPVRAAATPVRPGSTPVRPGSTPVGRPGGRLRGADPPVVRGLPVAQSSFVGRERELAELSGLLGRSRLITLIGPGGAGKTRLAIEAIRRYLLGEPTEPTEPTELTELTESGQPAARAESAQRAEPAKPAKPSEPAQSAEPSDPAGLARSSEPSEPSDPAGLARSSEPSEPSDPAGLAEPARPSESAEPVRPGEPAEEVVFVPLEHLRALESLVAAVAFALRVRDQPGTPMVTSVEAALQAAPRLLVLDGAEHLRSEVAELVSRLLTSVPGFRVVVTSRLLLGVAGEVCWTVPPLVCPSAAAPVSDISSSDAVQLFMARATERLPGLTSADVPPHAIAELCRRLDALPLAIELMAGWVGTLSVQEILQQQAALLSEDTGEPGGPDGPDGRGLAGVMRRSYELLQPEQQHLLPVLSVFAGAFALDDARAVSGLAGPALPRSIRGLVDASWLAVTRGGERNRFTMLETMRGFAGALLDERPDAQQVRGRHAAQFAELASGTETGLAGPEAASWKARAEAAIGDFNVALRWADEHGDTDLGLEMSAALWRWWLLSGRLVAGRNWLGTFLAKAGQRKDEPAGAACCSAAILAAEAGDYQEAIRQGRVALGIFERLDMPRRTALAATVLGSAHRYLGDLAATRRCFERAMALRETAGDRNGVSTSLNNLALLELDDGNAGRALELFEQALVIKRQLGERQSLAIGLNNLADVLIKLGRLDAAAAAVAEAAELATDLDHPQLIGTTRCNQGDIAAKRQRWPEAAEHYQTAMLAHQKAGHTNDAVLAMIGLGLAEYRLGRAGEAIRRLREAEAIATQIANPQRLAEVRAALTEVGADVSGALPDGLTARQAEVLRLLATGMSNKEIAGELYLSPATVERHLATIYRKLGLAGRVEATRYAVRSGLAGPAR